MKKSIKNIKAFTLTEMIVVIAIIAILAAILIPGVTVYINKARRNADYTEATSAYEMYNVKSADVYDEVNYVYYIGSNGYYFYWDKSGKIYFDLNDKTADENDVSQSVRDVINFEDYNYNKIGASTDETKYLVFVRISSDGSAYILDNPAITPKDDYVITYEKV